MGVEDSIPPGSPPREWDTPGPRAAEPTTREECGPWSTVRSAVPLHLDEPEGSGPGRDSMGSGSRITSTLVVGFRVVRGEACHDLRKVVELWRAFGQLPLKPAHCCALILREGRQPPDDPARRRTHIGHLGPSHLSRGGDRPVFARQPWFPHWPGHCFAGDANDALLPLRSVASLKRDENSVAARPSRRRRSSR